MIENTHKNDIKILVCYHKPYHLYQNDIYLPIQVGKARNNVDLGIQTDDSLNGNPCDNISHLNHLYCETTAMYWAWKNIRILYPDIKYVGLCHYRRYFSAEKHDFHDGMQLAYRRIKVSGKSLIGYHTTMAMDDPVTVISGNYDDRIRKSDEKLKDVIRSSEIVSTKPVCILNGSIRDFFSTIDRYYISLMEEIVKTDYPEYYPFLEKVLNGSKLHAANMIIMDVKYLDEYCSYIFGVMDRHMDLIKTRGICNDPLNEKVYSRIPGYLAELLTSSYVESKAGNLKINYTGKFFLGE